jgi:hypothetical protein
MVLFFEEVYLWNPSFGVYSKEEKHSSVELFDTCNME